MVYFTYSRAGIAALLPGVFGAIRFPRQFVPCLLLCTLLPLPNHAQTTSSSTDARWREAGLPFMQKYTVSDYGGTHQVWYIAQDRRGLMYFANRSSVLEYDGVS